VSDSGDDETLGKKMYLSSVKNFWNELDGMYECCQVLLAFRVSHLQRE